MRLGLLVPGLLISALVQAGPRRGLYDELQARFERSPARAKSKAACKGAWRADSAQTPQGKPYSVLTCPSSEQQLMVMGAAVFAIGLPLAAKVDFQHAEATMKDSRAQLAAAGCAVLRDQGQMALYDCPRRFAVALLDNWSSTTNLHTVSALFGPSDLLLPMLGASPAK